MNSDALAYLAARGFTVEEIVEFARLSERKADPTNAERQARHRAKRKAEKVTRYSNGVTPPIEELHTPCSDISPSGESQNDKRAQAEKFPCPPDVDPLDWAGLLQNRKTARKPMTDSAYRTIIRKLDGWNRDGWPPGPIVATAAERGWQTVFETDEMKNGRQPRSTDSFASLRGSRPNGALDMVLQAERELQAEAERENPWADRPARAALPPH